MEVNRNIITIIIVSVLAGFFLAANLCVPNNAPIQYEMAATTVTITPTKNRIQCPIPLNDRVINRTGKQCVYAAIETLGRWANEPKLMSPPLTSRPECQGVSNPYDVSDILNKLKVRYRQIYLDQVAGRELLLKAMKEGRGALFGVKGKTEGHAMVMVHYDENTIMYIDNSDKNLRINSMSTEQFNANWDRWVVVIYADIDIIPYRVNENCRNLPVVSDYGLKTSLPSDYIPIPTLERK
jgi:hypothetical protein